MCWGTNFSRLRISPGCRSKEATDELEYRNNVYSFGGGTAEGRAEMKNLLGGKGASLAEMANIGIPVPPVSP